MWEHTLKNTPVIAQGSSLAATVPKKGRFAQRIMSRGVLCGAQAIPTMGNS